MWDFMCDYILPIFLVIFLLIAIITLGILGFYLMQNSMKDKDYIQNIETKLNIYEQEYDNYVLKDSFIQ